MRYHRGRGRVLNFGVADYSNGFFSCTAENFGDGFLFGIILRILGPVGIHAESVDAGLVPRHVGGSRIGRVGGDGVHAAGFQG